jgi:Helicase associated domain
VYHKWLNTRRSLATRVPYIFEGFNHLGVYLCRLKKERRDGHLSADRIAKLDAIGFDWSPLPNPDTTALFDERVASILAYKQKHGTTAVPYHYKEDKKLGKFVKRVKTKRHSDQLSIERIRKLDAVGFDWTPQRILGSKRHHSWCNIDGDDNENMDDDDDDVSE